MFSAKNRSAPAPQHFLRFIHVLCKMTIFATRLQQHYTVFKEQFITQYTIGTVHYTIHYTGTLHRKSSLHSTLGTAHYTVYFTVHYRDRSLHSTLGTVHQTVH